MDDWGHAPLNSPGYVPDYHYIVLLLSVLLFYLHNIWTISYYCFLRFYSYHVFTRFNVFTSAMSLKRYINSI